MPSNRIICCTGLKNKRNGIIYSIRQLFYRMKNIDAHLVGQPNIDFGQARILKARRGQDSIEFFVGHSIFVLGINFLCFLSTIRMDNINPVR